MNFLRRYRKTIFLILCISFVVIFVNSFPNWLASKQTPPGMVFTGQASWFDPWDINVYVAAINWGQHRGFFMENTYTSEPNQAIFYYPVYTSLGALFPKENPFLLFHILASLAGIILVSTLTLIVRQLQLNQRETLFTVLIMCLGGGLGFLINFGQDSIDATMTSITLHSAFQRSHEGLALSAFFLSLFSFYFWLNKKRLFFQISTQVALVVALIFYPYNILSFIMITAVYLWAKTKKISWKSSEWRFWIITIFLGSLTVLAMALNLSGNSSFASVVSQSLSHPSISSFIFGYGLMLFLFIYQIIYVKPKTEIQKFLTIWIISAASLSFLPIGLSRFFLRGLYVPLTLTAIYALKFVAERYFPKEKVAAQNLLLINLLLLVSITSAQIFAGKIAAINEGNLWFYMTKEERSALDFIRDELSPNSTILTEYYMGNQIPANTEARVYFGHLLQTPNAAGKQEKIREFYGGKLSDKEAKIFLIDNNIQYVYIGREEQEVSYSFLRSIFEEDGVSIYEITK